MNFNQPLQAYPPHHLSHQNTQEGYYYQPDMTKPQVTFNNRQRNISQRFAEALSYQEQKRSPVNITYSSPSHKEYRNRNTFRDAIHTQKVGQENKENWSYWNGGSLIQSSRAPRQIDPSSQNYGKFTGQGDENPETNYNSGFKICLLVSLLLLIIAGGAFALLKLKNAENTQSVESSSELQTGQSTQVENSGKLIEEQKLVKKNIENANLIEEAQKENGQLVENVKEKNQDKEAKQIKNSQRSSTEDKAISQKVIADKLDNFKSTTEEISQEQISSLTKQGTTNIQNAISTIVSQERPKNIFQFSSPLVFASSSDSTPDFPTSYVTTDEESQNQSLQTIKSPETEVTSEKIDSNEENKSQEPEQTQALESSKLITETESLQNFEQQLKNDVSIQKNAAKKVNEAMNTVENVKEKVEGVRKEVIEESQPLASLSQNLNTQFGKAQKDSIQEQPENDIQTLKSTPFKKEQVNFSNPLNIETLDEQQKKDLIESTLKTIAQKPVQQNPIQSTIETFIQKEVEQIAQINTLDQKIKEALNQVSVLGQQSTNESQKIWGRQEQDESNKQVKQASEESMYSPDDFSIEPTIVSPV